MPQYPIPALQGHNIRRLLGSRQEPTEGLYQRGTMIGRQQINQRPADQIKLRPTDHLQAGPVTKRIRCWPSPRPPLPDRPQDRLREPPHGRAPLPSRAAPGYPCRRSLGRCSRAPPPPASARRERSAEVFAPTLRDIGVGLEGQRVPVSSTRTPDTITMGMLAVRGLPRM